MKREHGIAADEDDGTAVAAPKSDGSMGGNKSKFEDKGRGAINDWKAMDKLFGNKGISIFCAQL